MKRTLSLVWVTSLVLAACANPVNRVTMDDYADRCVIEEQAGRLDVASEAFRRAWINTRIGNLGSELESTALYNLGRVLRKSGKLAEAEEAMKRSLELEEKLSGPRSAKTGRRLAELSMNLIMQPRAIDGVPYVERLIPIAPEYLGAERKFVGAIFYGYAEDMKRLGKVDIAAKFEAAGNSLGFTRAELEKAA